MPLSTAGEPGEVVSVQAARAMPTTTGFTNSRWLGLGGIEITTSGAESSSRTRALAPAWYFTSPVQPRSSRNGWSPCASLNSARICA